MIVSSNFSTTFNEHHGKKHDPVKLANEAAFALKNGDKSRYDTLRKVLTEYRQVFESEL